MQSDRQPERKRLVLKRGESRRLRAGHLWVFSNEVDTARTPLSEYTPGDDVLVVDDRDRPIGCAYVNPRSLICARLVSRHDEHPLGEPLLVHRLNVALSLRERLFDRPYYRLVHGEGDGLPGLVVDRFGAVAVAQINTAGMERHRHAVVRAIRRVTGVCHVLLRCDAGVRELEGLERYVVWADDDPGPETLTVEENGCRFRIPALGGQKTGWYFDHAGNRRRLQSLVKGRTVLDLYSYLGAWGVEAAMAGADTVLGADASAEATEWIGRNADDNGVGDRMTIACGDAFELLAALRDDREHFDVVVTDPPAFIKRRKDLRKGLAAYGRLARMAMQVLSKDGILVAASCSSHLSRAAFSDSLLAAARHLDRSAQIIAHGHQGPDHPVHPAIPETEYIKTLFTRVFPAGSFP